MSPEDAWAVAARVAIHDLYGRWSHALDSGASQFALADFAEDGVLWASDRGSYRGREELDAIFQQRAGATMHVISTVLVEEVNGSSARSHAYFQLVDLATGAVVAWGAYNDELVHRDDRWRWHTKAVNFLWRLRQVCRHGRGAQPARHRLAQSRRRSARFRLS